MNKDRIDEDHEITRSLLEFAQQLNDHCHEEHVDVHDMVEERCRSSATRFSRAE